MSGQWSITSLISPAINTLEEVVDEIVLPHPVQPVYSSAMVVNNSPVAVHSSAVSTL